MLAHFLLLAGAVVTCLSLGAMVYTATDENDRQDKLLDRRFELALYAFVLGVLDCLTSVVLAVT